MCFDIFFDYILDFFPKIIFCFFFYYASVPECYTTKSKIELLVIMKQIKSRHLFSVFLFYSMNI